MQSVMHANTIAEHPTIHTTTRRHELPQRFVMAGNFTSRLISRIARALVRSLKVGIQTSAEGHYKWAPIMAKWASRWRPALSSNASRVISSGILSRHLIEPTDFAGVDLGDGHFDGVFALANFLFVLAIAQLAGNVDVLAFLQRLSKLGESAPDHDAVPLGAGVLARFTVLPGRLRCDVEANEFFTVLWTLEFRVLTDESD
jgi:hypothetical protein